MATGAPQVVIDIGGYRSFIDETTGVLIPVSSYSYLPMSAGVGLLEQSAHPDAVAEAMEKAVAMLGPATSKKCIEAARSRPWSKICDSFLESVLAK
jgi:hypothetical protein